MHAQVNSPPQCIHASRVFGWFESLECSRSPHLSSLPSPCIAPTKARSAWCPSLGVHPLPPPPACSLIHPSVHPSMPNSIPSLSRSTLLLLLLPISFRCLLRYDDLFICRVQVSSRLVIWSLLAKHAYLSISTTRNRHAWRLCMNPKESRTHHACPVPLLLHASSDIIATLLLVTLAPASLP